jgi:hypothetical protein
VEWTMAPMFSLWLLRWGILPELCLRKNQPSQIQERQAKLDAKEVVTLTIIS